MLDRRFTLEKEVIKRVQAGSRADTLFAAIATKLYKIVEVLYVSEEVLRQLLRVPASRTTTATLPSGDRDGAMVLRERVTFRFETLKDWARLWRNSAAVGGDMPGYATHGTLVCGGAWALCNK